MGQDSVSATAVIDAPAEVIFGVLADPTRHAQIDGTGRVGEPLDRTPLTTAGQMFRVAMYHENHPDGDYQMANRVRLIEPCTAIAWEPGYYADDGSVRFGGWFWHYDLTPTGPSATRVTLTYDWSAVPQAMREHIGFPPFEADHLDRSLAHLAQLVS